MSADRQRLKSAIQRIAKDDPEIRNLLGEGKNKGGKARSSGVGTSEAESDRQCCDGSTSSNANPGTEERDPDAEDASQEGGLNDDDPAKLDMGQGTLSGVTDCATGEPVCFHGDGFIPPDGWSDLNEPPDYDPDKYHVRLESKHRSACNAQASIYPLETSAYYVSMGECEPIQFEEEFTNVRYYERYVSKDDGEIDIRGPYDQTIERYDCIDEDTGVDHCEGLDKEKSTWPADGCVNITQKSGTLVGSQQDPENDGSYSAPRDEIELCDANGNQISLAPSADGGWKTINSTTNNGYLYDSSGQQIAHIDGNEYSDPNI